jgi:hypothetical protein
MNSRAVAAAVLIVLLLIAGAFYLERERSVGLSPEIKTSTSVSSRAVGTSAVASSVVQTSTANFEAIFWPTLLLGVGFGNASADVPFLTMLHQLGVQTVVIETDPSFFAAYESRMSSVISEARQMGFKIHIINQLGYTSWYSTLGIPFPFSGTPTIAQFQAFEYKAMVEYSSFHPDYLSVIAEPGLMDKKTGASFSDSQWQGLLENLTETVKSLSPQTQTWVDLVPNDPFDVSLLPSALQVPDMDGVGLDLYNSSTNWSAAVSMAQSITSSGKLGGLTETWAYDLNGDPKADTAATIPTQAQWLNVTGGAWAFASQYHMTSTFDPFFSEKLVTTAPLPAFTAAGLDSSFDQLSSALAAGNRTSVFYAYQRLIQG